MDVVSTMLAYNKSQGCVTYILSILGQVAGLVHKCSGMSQGFDDILGERQRAKNTGERRLRLGQADFELLLLWSRLGGVKVATR